MKTPTETETETRQTEVGTVPEEWGVGTLEDISLEITDGSHFSPRETPEGDQIIATVKDMRYNGFSFDGCKRILSEDFDRLVRDGCSPRKGDILISKDGANCLDLIFVYDREEAIVVLSSIAIVRLKPGFDPQFYRYFLLSPIAQEIMRGGYVTGSAIPRVVLKDLKKVPVPIPPAATQRGIARILHALDAKIELIHESNKTLEEIGSALFRDWFIDFEFPNEEGKPYKSSGGEMVYNAELGKEIPKGWETKPIDEIADFLNGLALQNFPPEREEQYLPAIKIRELRQGTTESSDRVSPNIPKEYIVDDGDVLFSWSGTLEVGLWTSGRGALNQHLFKVTSAKFPKWFCYDWILEHLPEYRRIAEGKATTMGHIQRYHLTGSLVLVPDQATLRRMDNIQGPIINKLVQAGVQSRMLSQVRDALLPKLVSGKIRVPTEVR